MNLTDNEDSSYFGLNKRESQIHELMPVISPQNNDDVSTFEQMEDSFELSEPSVGLELPIKPSF